jgi:4-cresol dehydrogenase (hydroxylating)
VLLYRDGYSPLWARPRSASFGGGGAEFRRAGAGRREDREPSGLPLYPISTGRNLTYGGARTAYSAASVVDLNA